MSLGDRIKMAIARGLAKLVDDKPKLQELQVQLLADEARGRAERFQDYGFTAVPFEGAECVVLFPNGNRSHPIVIRVDDRRYRKKDMQPGEVALYTDEGDYVHFQRGRIIEIKAGTRVRVDAPEAIFTGNLHVEGSITCDHDVSDMNGSMQEMRDTYNDHTHPETGSTTQAPNQEMS